MFSRINLRVEIPSPILRSPLSQNRDPSSRGSRASLSPDAKSFSPNESIASLNGTIFDDFDRRAYGIFNNIFNFSGFSDNGGSLFRPISPEKPTSPAKSTSPENLPCSESLKVSFWNMYSQQKIEGFLKEFIDQESFPNVFKILELYHKEEREEKFSFESFYKNFFVFSQGLEQKLKKIKSFKEKVGILELVIKNSYDIGDKFIKSKVIAKVSCFLQEEIKQLGFLKSCEEEDLFLDLLGKTYFLIQGIQDEFLKEISHHGFIEALKKISEKLIKEGCCQEGEAGLLFFNRSLEIAKKMPSEFNLEKKRNFIVSFCYKKVQEFLNTSLRYLDEKEIEKILDLLGFINYQKSGLDEALKNKVLCKSAFFYLVEDKKEEFLKIVKGFSCKESIKSLSLMRDMFRFCVYAEELKQAEKVVCSFVGRIEKEQALLELAQIYLGKDNKEEAKKIWSLIPPSFEKNQLYEIFFDKRLGKVKEE